jgi:methionyl-tRNA synthetase
LEKKRFCAKKASWPFNKIQGHSEYYQTMVKFYITTAIPYVNSVPHIGHALEFVQADVIARYHRQKGEEVLLLSGSDENALKNVQAAEQVGVPVQQFIDQNAKLFLRVAEKLDIHFDVFQKGSSKDHHSSSQKLWELCDRAGDIYKKEYEGLYCVGCETFYTQGEVDENQECFEHPGKKLDRVAEENYFFSLSKYQDKLVDLIERDELRIIPATRKNEVLSFLKQPLQDISISRSNERAKNWGVPVPKDDSQRMYVWFDALNIYQSGVGFGLDEEKYEKWWPANVHVIGKGITRFHAVYWPAFLLSAGLPLPKTLFVHGYITVDGQKMSKSLGNVIDPFDLTEKYGVDAVRYFFLRELSPTEDGDFSYKKFEARYNADLANGLGNQVSRVLRLATINEVRAKFPSRQSVIEKWRVDGLWELLENFEFNRALELIWQGLPSESISADKLGISSSVNEISSSIETGRPFDLNTPEKDRKQNTIDNLIRLWDIAIALEPFLPETAEKITQQLQQGKGASLFPRLGS